jgi:hypothetical protein
MMSMVRLQLAGVTDWSRLDAQQTTPDAAKHKEL